MTGSKPLPTGTVTFLLTDVEGSTTMWDADARAMAEAMGHHERILSEAIAESGGVRPIEQGEGDNVVAAFARASAAATAAIAAQHAFQEQRWPASAVISVRMGLHTGEAHLVDGRTYAGPDLNRCARVRGLAHGGQILLSRTTHDLLASNPAVGATFRDLGTHRLKGLDRAERVFQLRHPMVEDVVRPVVVGGERRTNLELTPPFLIGRARELAELMALSDRNRLVTITGAGGAGKTRLARLLAHTRRDAGDVEVWWVDLGSLSDPTVLCDHVLSVLDERGAHPSPGAVADVLGDRDVCIVLDNAEHLLEPCAELVEALLAQTGTVHVVVTSREPLGLEGECTWRIPSLDVPTQDASLAKISGSAAVELFVTRAAQVRPGFTVTEANAADIAQVCRRVDGLPLGIELAAARVRMMSPAAIADGLDDRFRLLTGGGRRAVARQRTLESSVAWSHDLLDPDEQQAFRLASVFAGGFTIETAEQVAAGIGVEPWPILDLLTRLVDKSLVVADGDGRYHLLETMRQFAHDRAVTAGEAHRMHDAHLRWFVELARRAERELTGSGQDQWLRELDRDHDNLRAALDWAADTDDHEALWALCGSLTFFWVLRGHFAEAERACRRAFAASEAVPEADQLAVRWGSAYAAFYAGSYDDAAAGTLDVIQRAEAAGNERYLARALDLLGTIEAFLDPDGARHHLHRAIEMAARVGDDWCLCDALQITAYSHLIQDQPDRAMPLVEESGSLAHHLGNSQLIAWDHAARSWFELRCGNVPKARAFVRDALAASDASGDPAAAGLATAMLGEAAIAQGQASETTSLLAERLERSIELQAGMAIPVLVSTLALCHAVAGDAVRALAVLEDPTTAGFGTDLDRMLQARNRALAEFAAGQRPKARTTLEDGIATAAASRSPVVGAALRLLLARFRLADGDAADARRTALEALDALTGTPPWPVVVDAACLLAALAVLDGQHQEAARLLGAVDAVLDRAGAQETASTVVLGRGDAASVRASIGDAFPRCWSEGSALSTEDLLAWLRRGRGPRRRPSTGWESLTPAEARVVDLAVEGLTNRVIADRLFISAGTVKTHLAHVYAKLGVRNRAELATRVAQRTRDSASTPA